MNAPSFATWKYQHPGAGYRSRGQLIAAVILGAAGIVFAALGFFPALGLIAVALFVALASRKKICIGPRYLICGQSIVYYRNVARMQLDEDAGILQLFSAGERPFVLERDKFPTNARKAPKIARNKAEKFAKVSRNLIAKVLRDAPAVETTGIPRAYVHE